MGRQQRKCAAHHFVLGTSQEGPAVASMNKYLAQINKSVDGVRATKKRSALRDDAGREGPNS